MTVKQAQSHARRQQQLVDDWNNTHPVGTEVSYYPVKGDDGFEARKTRSPAQMLSGHTAVVFLENKSGCVSLEHCIPVAKGDV